MTQPRQHIFRAMDLVPLGNGGAVDHQHRQAQFARGDEFRFGARAARVLADHKVDGVALQQRTIARGGKRPAIDHKRVVRQRWRLVRLIDETQQVMVLRLRSKCSDVHPPQRQQNAQAGAGERGNGRVDIGHRAPAVPCDRLPGGARQRDVRHVDAPGGLNGMSAHRGGEGVGRVDQMGHARFAQVIGKPVHAAEPADTHRHRLRARAFGAASIAESSGDAMSGQKAGQRAGFGGATQNKDFWHG